MVMGSSAWTPTTAQLVGADAGIVLAEKASADLGLEVGDDVELVHPVRLDDGGFTLGGSVVPVVITTHDARAGAVREAAAKIAAMDTTRGEPVVIRIVDLPEG